MSKKEDWELIQDGKWRCACCDTLLEPTDDTHAICPRCGLMLRLKDNKIQVKGNMMEDYE